MIAVEKLITDNLDIWTSAIKTRSSAGRGSSNKIELYGIKKLRELILELAVRGLLVPQDPNDESATILLKKASSKKAKLIEEGKIKKPKQLKSAPAKPTARVLPKGWLSVLLQDIAIVDMGNSPPGHTYNDTENGVPLINGPVEFSKGPFGKTIKSKFTTAPNVMCQKGDILVCVRGATTGRTNIADFNACIGRGVARVKALVNQRFVNLLMWENQQRLLAKGTGTTFPSISYPDLAGHLVLLPPENEQHRIVAKVDELMALCDQLEQQTESSITAHKTLVETLLGALTNAPDHDSFQQAWQRIAEHFDTLFTTEHSIDQLKQTILQLAVMGKLVPQDPNDEPASELLKRIAAEKAKLIKEGKIKKQKPLPPISDKDKPFTLPDGWVFTRLDDLCFGITSGSTPPKSNFTEEPGVPYLKVYNIRNQKIDFKYKPQFIDHDCHTTKLKRSILYPGDVVMNIVGPPLGKIALVPESHPEWNCNQAITFFRPIHKELNKYIYTYLKAGIFLDSIELIGTAGQDNISVTKSRSIVLPMPPVNEQKRITDKLEKLMSICAQLADQINKTKVIHFDLANTITSRSVS
ncbi:MAG: restriction endonuclease subunit S [Ketobacter sp.]|nr:restriction endonuclease subunit S [Ketobacter sp.]